MRTRVLGSLPLAFVLFSTALFGQDVISGMVVDLVGPVAQAPPRDPNARPSAQPTGTARIKGRVVAADSGNPLRRAQVRLMGSQIRNGQTANTDEDGRYEFMALPAGQYNINVAKPGYVSLSFGQQRPLEPGKPLILANGQVAEKIDFLLPRGSVITGRITDEFGEPMPGVRLEVMRYQYMPDGKQQLSPAYNAGGPSFGLLTDDLGQFRVYGLIPGTYVLAASPSNVGITNVAVNSGDTINIVRSEPQANNGYLTTFYPGTPNADEAQAITVGVGQEVSAFFSVVPGRLALIAGTVRDSQGHALFGSNISLRTVRGTISSMIGGASLASDGSFVMSNVPPGEHFLEVRPRFQPPGMVPAAVAAGGTMPEPEFASVPITVSGQDITGLVITTTPGAIVSGRLIFNGTRAVNIVRGGTNSTRVMTTTAEMGNNAFTPPVSNSLDNGVVDESGRFQIRGVAGRVLFRPIGLAGWFMKSVSLNGSDITDIGLDVRGGTNISGLEIVLSDQSTTLSGVVRNTQGETVKDYVVAILPDHFPEAVNPSRFMRTVRPDQNGQYKTTVLPAGEYIAFAVESLEPGRLYDPAYQQKMKPHGKSFTLIDGQTATLDLELVQ